MLGGGSACRHEAELLSRVRASWVHCGRVEIQFPGAGVVPDEVEGPGAGGDALVVADPPGSFLRARADRAVARVEGSGGPKRSCRGSETSKTSSTLPPARANAEIATRPASSTARFGWK